MTQDEIIEMATTAFEICNHIPNLKIPKEFIEIFAKLVAAKAIAELESQEPVGWLLTEKNINSLQVDSIQLLIDRLKHAHHTDLCVRINGQDEWFQADWLKHMVRATLPQRTWVGLTDEDKKQMAKEANYHWEMTAGEYAERIGQLTEAKLKERNT